MAGEFFIKGACLTAKHKLNAAHVNGALAIAAVIGIASESFLVFLLVAALLIAGSMHDGSIRK
jgi:hypothetical protein